jgi:serine/threonine protein kinase
MYYAFQDRENLYLVMDLLSGGDLRYHICRYRKFDEETTSKYLILNITDFFELCVSKTVFL